jgi:hypothetical protein
MGWVGDQKMPHSWCNPNRNRLNKRVGWPVPPPPAFSGTPCIP